jgi:hypothetical protein
MKAILINPENRSIDAVDLTGRDDLVGLIGYDTIESDAVGTAGDRLYFDEECFLRGTTGRFQIDTLVPVSGKAVIVGSNEDGSTLRDVATRIDELRSRIKYLLATRGQGHDRKLAQQSACRAGHAGCGS